MKKNLLFTVGAMTVSTLFVTGCAQKVMTERTYVPIARPDIVSQDTTASGNVPTSDNQGAAVEQVVVQQDNPEQQTVAPKPLPPVQSVTYVVKKGDTLGAIARNYGLHYSEIMQANNIKDARKIRPGQKLVIPSIGEFTPIREKAVAPKAKRPKKATKNLSPVEVPAAELSGNVYIVKKGDNIPKIARKLRVKASDLMAANNLDAEATRRLQIGQKLVIPGKNAPALPIEAPVAQSGAETVRPEVTLPPADASAVNDAPAVQQQNTVPDISADSAASTTPKMVEADTDLAAFAAANNTTVDEMKKANADTLPKDGILKAGTIVFIPVK